MTRAHRLAIVASHVIQYQAPLFRMLAAQHDIDLTVLYCSRLGSETFHDADMATSVRWDLDLLSGYRSGFLTNLAPARAAGFLRHVNPGIIPALARGRYDAVLFMTGWGSLTAVGGMVLCRVAGIPFLIFGDSSFPPPETTLPTRLRAALLRGLFKMASGFAVSGSLNATYYEHYGADRQRFFLVPFAIDNERFAGGADFAEGERGRFRASHGIDRDSVTIVFSGKLVERKDPLTLLHAYERMRSRDRCSLLFVGEGALRGALERYAREKSIERVHFAGFVNQGDLPKYYGASDVFALPSTYEPRGLVVNEAMAVGLPIVVSDRCGAIGDIAIDGANALVFPAGDPDALAAKLDTLAADATLRARMASRSREIIAGWSYDRAVEGIREALQWLAAGVRR
jgi:glycosyltransferase involved in cell wall biosynthesis